MILILGGFAQGKTEYAKKKYPERHIVDDYAQSFRKWLSDGTDPEREIAEILRKEPECVIISDEVSSGVIPMDKFEREYRERLGRSLVKLAAEAEHVERIFAGIGVALK
ncbi:MAG: bifunctional adenosylcobinamide kinase/adenosylcobinamide-phosphate guanylyltransferase [Lachnospiraceae bacterium]|nr:bifunctional adenosylcobinamide kinase/adenosylcobinamide-phosphate guanylyltransferase [Lachnospiraceae bacterium]